MATPSSKYIARIIVAPSKNTVGDVLSIPIVKSCQSALESRDVFTIALSGGSLPSFLQSLPTSFEIAGVDPQWGKWRVLLADERCVESTHEDSNLGSIQKNFTSHVPIPAKHVYGIKESLLSESSLAIARSYEDNVVKPLLEKSGGMLDCVVLGFGPDGHTCSLFPNHPLLLEENAFVASIDDSPKPPPSRITLTFPIINKLSRKVIFCGAGSTKSAILTDIFGESSELACFAASNVEGAKAYDATLNDPAPYPCGMVRPQGKGSLVWVVDADAAKENIFG